MTVLDLDRVIGERGKRGSMSKMKFSNYQAKQSRIVEGVCVPISDAGGDYEVASDEKRPL